MSVYHKGHIEITSVDEATREYDAFMCCHCNAIIVVERTGSTELWSPPSRIALIGEAQNPDVEANRQKKRRSRGFCFRCMGPTCGRGNCAQCVPFEAKLEAIEGSRRFWKDVDLVTGERV